MLIKTPNTVPPNVITPPSPSAITAQSRGINFHIPNLLSLGNASSAANKAGRIIAGRIETGAKQSVALATSEGKAAAKAFVGIPTDLSKLNQVAISTDRVVLQRAGNTLESSAGIVPKLFINNTKQILGLEKQAVVLGGKAVSKDVGNAVHTAISDVGQAASSAGSAIAAEASKAAMPLLDIALIGGAVLLVAMSAKGSAEHYVERRYT